MSKFPARLNGRPLMLVAREQRLKFSPSADWSSPTTADDDLRLTQETLSDPLYGIYRTISFAPGSSANRLRQSAWLITNAIGCLFRTYNFWKITKRQAATCAIVFAEEFAFYRKFTSDRLSQGMRIWSGVAVKFLSHRNRSRSREVDPRSDRISRRALLLFANCRMRNGCEWHYKWPDSQLCRWNWTVNVNSELVLFLISRFIWHSQMVGMAATAASVLLPRWP